MSEATEGMQGKVFGQIVGISRLPLIFKQYCFEVILQIKIYQLYTLTSHAVLDKMISLIIDHFKFKSTSCFLRVLCIAEKLEMEKYFLCI